LLEALREVLAGDPALAGVVASHANDVPVSFELDAVSPIVRAVVEQMEEAGALSLAYSTLATLDDADLPLRALERGRVLAQLGRVAWKSGALETAREQYRRAEVLGRTARIPELRVRAWVGYSIVARMRGNYPEVRKWGARALHEAERAGLSALEPLAYHSLMVSAAMAGDYSSALAYGWRSYQGAVGDKEREARALLHLSQCLLECGHPAAAVRGFAAALDRQQVARIAFPALGGLAVAAAAVGDRALVLAARAQIEHLIASAPFPYQSAAALLELAQAFTALGDTEDAAACSARALELARRHAYHEIVHRLEALHAAPRPGPADTPHELDPTASEVAQAVASLAVVGTTAGAY
jgi:tetratricopeptide (TPR) repeat protein